MNARKLTWVLLFALPVLIGCRGYAQTVSTTQSVATRGSATDSDLPYVAVFIDKETEDKMGRFPYDRAVYARAIQDIDQLGARAVVVKLFLDERRSAAGDTELEKAIANAHAKVILEARFDNATQKPNDFPERFELSEKWPQTLHLISGKAGWIPLSQFSAHAFDMGFAEVQDTEHVPTIFKYRDKFVKSVFTCAIEAGFDDLAHIKPAQSLSIKNHTVRLASDSGFSIAIPKKDSIDYVSFQNIIAGRAAEEKFKNRVVILGYDGPTAPTIDTKIGRVRVHRWFWHMLVSSYEKIRDAQPE